MDLRGGRVNIIGITPGIIMRGEGTEGSGNGGEETETETETDREHGYGYGYDTWGSGTWGVEGTCGVLLRLRLYNRQHL